MKKKAGDRVVVNSKYFNEFNDLEGVIDSVAQWGEGKFNVKIDDRDGLVEIDSKDLKLISDATKNTTG